MTDLELGKSRAKGAWWPTLAIGIGIALTVTWIGALVYALIKLIEFAI